MANRKNSKKSKSKKLKATASTSAAKEVRATKKAATPKKISKKVMPEEHPTRIQPPRGAKGSTTTAATGPCAHLSRACRKSEDFDYFHFQRHKKSANKVTKKNQADGGNNTAAATGTTGRRGKRTRVEAEENCEGANADGDAAGQRPARNRRRLSNNSGRNGQLQQEEIPPLRLPAHLFFGPHQEEAPAQQPQEEAPPAQQPQEEAPPAAQQPQEAERPIGRFLLRFFFGHNLEALAQFEEAYQQRNGGNNDAAPQGLQEENGNGVVQDQPQEAEEVPGNGAAVGADDPEEEEAQQDNGNGADAGESPVAEEDELEDSDGDVVAAQETGEPAATSQEIVEYNSEEVEEEEEEEQEEVETGLTHTFGTHDVDPRTRTLMMRQLLNQKATGSSNIGRGVKHPPRTPTPPTP